jgi:hypothetical protein
MLPAMLVPQAEVLVLALQRPELRGAICRLYSRMRWLLLVSRGHGGTPGSGSVGEDEGGGACPASAPRLLAFWFQIVLGGVAPLAVAYLVEARAKERFLGLQSNDPSANRRLWHHLLLLLNLTLLGVMLATGLTAQGEPL